MKAVKAIFIIYRDINTQELYLEDVLCKDFGITGKKRKMIKNRICSNVTEEQIRKIEQRSEMGFYPLEAVIKDVQIKQNTEREFTYYYLTDTKEYYIPRTTYELCLNLKVEVEGKPKIIQEHNCYSITKMQLQTLMRKGYLGNKISINLEETKQEEPQDKSIIIVYKDRDEKLYIPEKYGIKQTGKVYTITGKQCYEITEQELEKIYNRKIIIVKIAIKPEKKQIISITICTTETEWFIPEEIIVQCGLDLSERRKIRVDGKPYIQINELDMVEIKKALGEIEINTKKIWPMSQKRKMEETDQGSIRRYP